MFDVIADKLRELDGYETRVGWPAGQKYENGAELSYVAAIQEFGKHARPFIRPTIADKTNSWLSLMARGAKAIIEHGESVERVYGQVGEAAAGDIAETITKINSPPLSPITILLRYWRRQGRKISGKTVGEAASAVNSPGYQKPDVSEKPLVDTANMLHKLTHEVNKV